MKNRVEKIDRKTEKRGGVCPLAPLFACQLLLAHANEVLPQADPPPSLAASTLSTSGV